MIVLASILPRVSIKTFFSVFDRLTCWSIRRSDPPRKMEAEFNWDCGCSLVVWFTPFDMYSDYLMTCGVDHRTQVFKLLEE